MTNEQIRLVKTSFAKIEPVEEEAAVLFYAWLFHLDPDLRPLFTSDIREQGHKLMRMLKLAVEGLERPEILVPSVRALGARHAAYGVEEKDYETVAAALLWMLEKALAEAFTAETKEAWIVTYQLLAGAMKEGAREPAEAAAGLA